MQESHSYERFVSGLRFYDYIVNKVEFYNNEDHDGSDSNLDFRLEREIKYLDDENNTMLVTLHAFIFEGASEKNYPFHMNVSVTGIFGVGTEDLEHRETFAATNAIAILFPYVRSLVTTFTGNANVNPLILPVINVVKMVEAQ